MLDPLKIPWDTLTQFAGGMGFAQHTLVHDFITLTLYLVLFVVAYTKLNVYHQPRERWFKWGFGLALLHALLTVIVTQWLKPQPTLLLASVYLPLHHALLTAALILIVGGYLHYFQRREVLCKRYIKAGISSTLLLSAISLLGWHQQLLVQPNAVFAQGWYAWLLAGNALFWLVLAMYAIARATHYRMRIIILLTLALFAFGHALALRPVWLTAEPLRWDILPHLSDMLALLLLSYAYLLEAIMGRKSTLIALRDSEAKLNTMLKTITDLVWLKNPDGVYLACNAVFERLYGAKEYDIVGKTDYDFVDAKLADSFRAHDKLAIVHNAPSTNEEWVTYADGRQVLLETTKTPMRDNHGRLIGVLGISHDITERHQKEMALQESEARLRTMFECSKDAVVVLDEMGFIDCNTAALTMFGCASKAAFCRLHPADISPPTQANGENSYTRMHSYIQQAMHEGNQHFEWTHLRLDTQELVYVDVMLNAMTIQGKQVLHGVLRNITERKQAEGQIQNLTNLYKALSEVNQAIVRMQDQVELFPLVCRCAVEFGQMQLAWVGQLDETTGIIHRITSYGHHQEYLDGLVLTIHADQAEGRGPAGIALRENRIATFNDIQVSMALGPWRDKLMANGWQSIAAIPIPRGGQPFAVLIVYHQQKNAFDQESLTLLAELASNIGFAFDNFDREETRRQAEESKRLAALVYESSSEAMVVTDEHHLIITVNPAFTQITGYAEHEVLGKSHTILKSGRQDDRFYDEMWQAINSTGKWQGEIWNRRKNGEVYPQWLTINTIYHPDGAVKHRISMFTDISQKKQSEEVIWRQANFDPLTGLSNRRMFYESLTQAIKKSQRTTLPLVLLYLDLDLFKEVNDTLGHVVGDQLLKETAQRLTNCVRDIDIISRLGGDEFTIILNEVNDLSSVDRVCKLILTSIAEPFQLGDDVAYVSASIGITIYPTDADEVDDLMKKADQAMYMAKTNGRNQYSYFTQAMQDAAQRRMGLTNDLHVALQKQQIWVAYQPIVDLRSGRIAKAEALARWQHPKHGLIRPDEFIPIAEHTGLIHEIGDWIFRQAVQQVKHWQTIYHPQFHISVNKSPIQIHSKSARFVPWHTQLQEAGLAGQSIVAEITEGLLLEVNASIHQKLYEFHEAGIQLALDDFGTGYSSLSYLKKFDIDYIKIDRSFVSHLASQSEDLALCEAIILIAHKLGMQVIAEGIETPQQRDLLIAAGCDFGQGYLFNQALTAAAFEQLLLADRHPAMAVAS